MPDASKPFRVRTTDGVLRSEHRTPADAKAAEARANEAATKADLKTRYVFSDESSAAA